MEYKLVMDKQVIDEYCDYYFSIHTRAWKKPIERPLHPSLNTWMILPRVQMNTLKQKWKDFGVWWIKKLGYDGLMLDKFAAEVTVYMPSRRRFDLDNHCNEKFLWDAFIEAGFIVDDDCDHLTSLLLKGGYDKENPRTEIIIRTVDN